MNGPLRHLVIGSFEGRRLAALTDGERLIDLQSIAARAEDAGDAVYLGRVVRIDRALGGAFVDIGEGEPGFLSGRDARFAAGGAGERKAIQHLTQEGARVVVQVVREASGEKGRRLTSDVKLAGPAVIFSPHRSEVTIARALKGPSRARLAETAGARLDGGGWFLRAHADAFEADDLEQQAEALRSLWRRIEQAASEGAPRRLWAGEGIGRWLWPMLVQGLSGITVAEPELATGLRRELERLPEGLRPQMETVAGDVFASSGIDDEIALLLQPEVPLLGGGRITIEPTTALIAIDVDGGGRAALDVDLEAAGEIARQLRLRNLGGIVVIDFVDLPTKPQRQQLEQALKRAFRDDPLPVDVYPLSPLGLVQLTRARRGRPLPALGRIPCPSCDGRGTVTGL